MDGLLWAWAYVLAKVVQSDSTVRRLPAFLAFASPPLVFYCIFLYLSGFVRCSKPGGGPEQEVDLIKKKKVVNTSIYPDEVIERLARCFYPAILEYFNSEEGQRAFAAWQAEQARLTAKEKQDVPNGERPALHTDRKRLFSDEAYLSGCAFLFVLQCSFGQGTSP